jgi:DNA-binding NtrC family response regulator
MSPSRPLRVLVVEDERLIRWSISETLGSSGHTVVEAADAASAREAVAAAPFDAVLLDYRLPDSNDLTLLADIRRMVPGSPVILMTAFGSPEVVEGALGLGVYKVMNKPLEMETLEGLLLQATSTRPA